MAGPAPRLLLLPVTNPTPGLVPWQGADSWDPMPSWRAEQDHGGSQCRGSHPRTLCLVEREWPSRTRQELWQLQPTPWQSCVSLPPASRPSPCDPTQPLPRGRCTGAFPGPGAAPREGLGCSCWLCTVPSLVDQHRQQGWGSTLDEAGLEVGSAAGAWPSRSGLQAALAMPHVFRSRSEDQIRGSWL